MIYLASPYSHPDAVVREQRFRAACGAAACLMRSGRHVFSPIVHSHGIAEHGVPTDWSYWEAFDSRMLTTCNELVAVMLNGWRESTGVQAEIDLAHKIRIPIYYLDITYARFPTDGPSNEPEPAKAGSGPLMKCPNGLFLHAFELENQVRSLVRPIAYRKEATNERIGTLEFELDLVIQVLAFVIAAL